MTTKTLQDLEEKRRAKYLRFLKASIQARMRLVRFLIKDEKESTMLPITEPVATYTERS